MGRGIITTSRTACGRAEQEVSSWRKSARAHFQSSSKKAKNRFSRSGTCCLMLCPGPCGWLARSMSSRARAHHACTLEARSQCYASEGEKSHFAAPGVDLCRCRSNLARAQFRATASVMGTTPPHAHLPERRACSCKGPKKPHRNLVGLRRTASRSPRSVLSARAPPRSFITAIGVCRRDFTA